MKKRLSAFIIIFLLICGISASAAEKCMLWKVEDENSFIYLLGSIHIANRSFYPLNKAYYDAYDETKVLAVEADSQLLDPLKMQKIIMETGMYQNGKTLRESVSRETLEEYDKYLKSRGMKPGADTNMKPWFLAMSLMLIELQKMGFNAQLGLDKHFMNKARASGKEIVEIESAEYQLKLLGGLSDKLQDFMLFSTFKDIAKLEDEFPKLLSLWKKGEAKKLDDYLKETYIEIPRLKPLMVKMFDKRNIGMAEKASRFLLDDKLCLIIVGAGHLVGEKGVIALLKEKGYKPVQVMKK